MAYNRFSWEEKRPL